MIIDLKKYRDIFGKPNEGVHSYRLFGLAAIDVIFTLMFALLFTIISSQSKDLTIYFLIYTLVLFSLAIFFHRIFFVNTTINKLLFGII
jgi:hypothetical protein